MAAKVHPAWIMWIYIAITIFTGLAIDSYVFNFLANAVMATHKVCLELSPTITPYKSDYAAMICGENLRPDLFTLQMRTLGIFHLMVVSGSHFVFLEQALSRALKFTGRWATLFIFLILSLFALACQLAPPVTRAWWSLMLRKINQEHKLAWRDFHITAYSGVVCICIYPEWLHSLSFELSWAASFFISLPSSSSFKRHFYIYVGLLPLMAGLQPQHPFTVLINWLFAPIIGNILLPVCLVAMFVPALTTLTDLVWSLFEWTVNQLSRWVPVITSDPAPNSHLLVWLYLASAHALLYFCQRNKERGKL